MKKLLLMLVLLLSTQVVPANNLSQSLIPDNCSSTTCAQGEHSHHFDKIQLGQQQWFIAVCSRNDLNMRFHTLEEARRCADEHARATGHRTGVIRG